MLRAGDALRRKNDELPRGVADPGKIVNGQGIAVDETIFLRHPVKDVSGGFQDLSHRSAVLLSPYGFLAIFLCLNAQAPGFLLHLSLGLWTVGVTQADVEGIVLGELLELGVEPGLGCLEPSFQHDLLHVVKEYL